jgi:hypothetical protein
MIIILVKAMFEISHASDKEAEKIFKGLFR